MNYLKPTHIFIAITFVSLLFLVNKVDALGTITLSKSSISISEDPSSSNHSDEFVLSLNPKPSSAITLSFSTNSQCELAVEASGFSVSGQIVSLAHSFSFDVRAIDDDIEEGTHSCQVNFYTESSTDSNYNGATKSVNFTILDDNDKTFVPSISVVETTPGNIAEGDNAIYRYKLVFNANLDDPATVTAYGGPQCEMVVSLGGSEVRSNAAESYIEAGQSESDVFTVIARQDDIYEGPHSCLISHSVATTDLTFEGVSVPPYVIAVGDDDPTYLQEQKTAEEEQEKQDLISLDVGLIDPFDGNNDGTEDSKQPSVQTFLNVVSGQRNTVFIEGNCQIAGSVISTPQRSSVNDENLHFPHGLIDFTLKCDQKNSAATINWLLDQNYPTNYPWLLRSISQGGVDIIASAQFSSYELKKGNVTHLSYVVQDGGEFDGDGEDNGKITGTIGLGLPIGEISQANSSMSQEGSGLGRAILYSAVAVLVLVTIAWIAHKPKNRKRLHDLIIGKPSDEPRIDKF